jgi:hypothetical protein
MTEGISGRRQRYSTLKIVQQYLGHQNITHTVRDKELSPERFKTFFGEIEETSSTKIYGLS